MMKIFGVTINKRPLLYSAAIGAQFALLFIINELFSSSTFILFAFLGSSVLLVEIVYSMLHHHAIPSQEMDGSMHHGVVQSLHHLLVPAGLYFGYVGFIDISSNLLVHLLSLVFVSVCFVLLFEHIYDVYNSSNKVTKKTAYVYDLVSVAIIFFVSLSCLVYLDSTLTSIAGILFTTLTLFGLALLRHELTREAISYIGAYLFSIILLVFVQEDLSDFTLSLIFTILFSLVLNVKNTNLSKFNTTHAVIDHFVVLALVLVLLSLYGAL